MSLELQAAVITSAAAFAGVWVGATVGYARGRETRPVQAPKERPADWEIEIAKSAVELLALHQLDAIGAVARDRCLWPGLVAYCKRYGMQTGRRAIGP